MVGLRCHLATNSSRSGGGGSTLVRTLPVFLSRQKCHFCLPTQIGLSLYLSISLTRDTLRFLAEVANGFEREKARERELMIERVDIIKRLNFCRATARIYDKRRSSFVSRRQPSS